LTDTDLRELGLALDDRKRLPQAIARLDGATPSTPVVAQATASGPITGSSCCFLEAAKAGLDRISIS
jgi:hypothetical protein